MHSLTCSAFSLPGLSHDNKESLNQDFILSDSNGSLSAITLADGVTSCIESRRGAELSCYTLMKMFMLNGSFFMNAEPETASEIIISHVLSELEHEALTHSMKPEDYSCTLAGVLEDSMNGKIIYFSTGDSIIIGIPESESEKIQILARPKGNNIEGVCTVTTRGAASVSEFGIMNTDNFSSVIICSDGAWREMFDRNILRREAAEILHGHDYEHLKKFFRERKIFDDCSFIAMNLNESRKEKTA